LKRASKKLSQLASASFAAALVCAAASGTKQPARVNELTLAGLCPGRDSLHAARSRYREPMIAGTKDDPNHYLWHDPCNRRDLTVEAGADGLIKSVQVGPPFGIGVVDCAPNAYFPRAKDRWRTGRGLGIGDACGRAVEIYGKPESESPSAKGSEQLQLLFYSFDWAGTDVPQVMEVTCSRENDRVVEILLAASSL